MRPLHALCLVLGAVILSGYAGLFLLLMPVERAATDFAALVRQPMWVPLAVAAMAGLAAMTGGLLALIGAATSKGLSRDIAASIVVASLVLNVANLTWEAFVYPAIAHHPRSAFLLNDRIIIDFDGVQLFHLCRIVTSVLALIVIVWACLRLSRRAAISGIAMALGLCSLTFEAVAAPAIIVLGLVALCAGSVALSREMLAAG